MDTGTTDGFIRSLENQIEYERKANTQHRRDYDKLWIENVKLHNENVRLRKALETISENPSRFGNLQAQIARKALENKDD